MNRIFVPKQRKSFDDSIKEGEKKIDCMNKPQLEKFRNNLKKDLDCLHNLIRTSDSNTHESAKKYWKGKRMVITSLLAYSKKRKADINRVLNNGTSKDFAVRFVTMAHDILDIDVFQKIYGLTLTEDDIKNQTIEDVKTYMIECKQFVKGDD